MNLLKVFRAFLTPPAPLNHPKTFSDTYWAYTTQFDQVLEAEELPRLLGAAKEEIDTAETAYRKESQGWLAAANAEWLTSCPQMRAEDVAITLLIDHSGSMRGQRIQLARAIAEMLTDGLGRLGASVEVLGFTTSSWKGGAARQMWLNEARPKNPGRLCELLHVVYRPFGAPSPVLGHAARYMFHPELLKENVDGEALLWAADRLRAQTARKRLIVVISDGAPVDDSTLGANPPSFLWDHAIQVVKDLELDGIPCAGIGLDQDIGAVYPTSICVHGPDGLGKTLAEFLSPLLD